MYKTLKPNIYVKSIFNINYESLKQQDITTILFDIDNTIAPTNIKEPTKEVINLFNKLKENGFNVLILSNALPFRAKRFGNILESKTYYLSCKPLSINYKRIINKLKLDPNEIAAIGDQIYTDIKGANKMNIKSILVDPISSKEGILTKINRLKETKLINKSNIIERGNYYE